MAFDQGYALVIGVGHYQDETLSVPITANDANAVATVLKDEQYCGYHAKRVTILTNKDATKAGVLNALAALALATKAEDTVVIFHSGHGGHSKDGNYYLLTHDVQTQNGRVVPGSGISEQELLAALRAIPAKRVLIIFNACYSGRIGPSSLGPEWMGENPTEDLANKLLATGEGRILITACREKQKSWFLTNETLTIFSQALVDGLRGNSLTPQGGFVTAFDLYTAIHKQVKQRSTELGPKHKQEPEITIIKGVGPFAVSLYCGETNTDALKVDQASLPKGKSVRSITLKSIQKYYEGDDQPQNDTRQNYGVFIKQRMGKVSGHAKIDNIGNVNGDVNLK